MPSPLDRTRAARLSLKCMQFLEQYAVPYHYNTTMHKSNKSIKSNEKASAATITIQANQIIFAPVEDVLKAADMKNRRGKQTWWSELKGLAEMMGGRAGLVEEGS